MDLLNISEKRSDWDGFLVFQRYVTSRKKILSKTELFDLT